MELEDLDLAANDAVALGKFRVIVSHVITGIRLF